MANPSGAAVSLADIYGLLLDDIRRNRAARLARETAQHSDADQVQADDEAQRVGVNDGQ